ncbi:DUF1540 domain-containing protein [Clostridium thermobutyricum]|uniref:DUF1540 domain-containing protein n=1 Tax=Clostridium thermobutyricum TaxID=29372 RepID=N9WI96_9CLOT|nr:DUF1540 domain-containing protein [Clostridium thermobutyricum]ENZ02625.1 hypothetical protein HMPREF1092_01860 [Clostridium thermobutyricum]
MTTLRCGVTDCNHNKQNCCCNIEITVGGQEAEIPSDTRCKNFDYKYEALSSDIRDINPNLYINCCVDKCIYNKAQMCTAKEIEVGNNLKSYESDTQCNTFVER